MAMSACHSQAQKKPEPKLTDLVSSWNRPVTSQHFERAAVVGAAKDVQNQSVAVAALLNLRSSRSLQFGC